MNHSNPTVRQFYIKYSVDLIYYIMALDYDSIFMFYGDNIILCLNMFSAPQIRYKLIRLFRTIFFLISTSFILNEKSTIHLNFIGKIFLTRIV